MHLKNLLCKQRVKRGSLLLFPSRGCLLQGDLQSKGNNLTAQEIERELQDWRESMAEKLINTEPSCQGSGRRAHSQAGPCSSFTPLFLPLGCGLEVLPAFPGISSHDEFWSPSLRWQREALASLSCHCASGVLVAAVDSANSVQQSHLDEQCLPNHPSSFLLRFASEKLLILFLFLFHPHPLTNSRFRLLSWKAQTRAGSACKKSDKLFSCGHSVLKPPQFVYSGTLGTSWLGWCFDNWACVVSLSSCPAEDTF